MKVSKFGGTSVASKERINKVIDIINDDSSRKYIVVSAPGKRFLGDSKLTDVLIQLAKTKDEQLIPQIIERFEPEFHDALTQNLKQRLAITDDSLRSHAIMAFGEFGNAYQIAQLSNIPFVDASELLDVALDSSILPTSFEKITKRLQSVNRAIIPGFYGADKNGNILTLGRGSSDLTGAYIAAAMNASEYENFTDSGVCVAHPDIIGVQDVIETMTYKELRNLSFGGFSIFHPRSMLPLIEKNIPIHIRSTANYPQPGTVVQSSKNASHIITGIAYEDGYTGVNVNMVGIHETVGIMARICDMFTQHNVSIDFTPTGIDDITVVARNVPKTLLDELQGVFPSVQIDTTLGCIVVAGEGLKGNRGSAAKIQDALSTHNIRFISHGIDESCIIYGISANEGKSAVKKLYETFLKLD